MELVLTRDTCPNELRDASALARAQCTRERILERDTRPFRNCFPSLMAPPPEKLSSVLLSMTRASDLLQVRDSGEP